MRIAFISDIHGNLVSLDSVLADIEQAQVDQLICLGDVANLGPQPRQVIRRLKELSCACVMGNHDHFLIDPSTVASYTDADWFIDTVDWCASQLTCEDIDFLRTFMPLIWLDLGHGQSLLCFHGSPQSDRHNLLASVPAAELDQMLGPHRATVMVGGHTHVQMVRQHDGILLVNAGSAGMPFERMPFVGSPRIMPWAEYAIISAVDGVIGVELRRVPIDLAVVRQAAIDNGMPDKGEWLENWVLGWYPGQPGKSDG